MPTAAGHRHRHLQRDADKAGIYFDKIACFCFTEQTLAAGPDRRHAGQLLVDPAILTDPDLDDVDTITLSYTFFRAADDAARSEAAAAPRRSPARTERAADPAAALGLVKRV